MTELSRRILCDTNPMCYGSSSALLSILDPLRELFPSAHITALTQGITHELLGADPAVDHTIEVDLKDSASARAALRERDFDAVLVISNQSNIEVYVELGVPIYFVDILYFFGARKDRLVWQTARRTFVQAFPGVRERLERVRPVVQPEIIGPLVRARAPSTDTPRHGTLVNLGGGRSRWVVPGQNTRYPELVVSWIEALAHHLPRPLTLAAGSDAAKAAREVVTLDELDVRTMPQPEFLDAMRDSTLYITAPGLNAVFEGALIATDMLILPPQNATQVSQLITYEREGLVHPGINLPSLDPAFDPRTIDGPEAGLTAEVLRSLARLEHDPRAHAMIVDHLLEQLARRDARRANTQAFMKRLGGAGGVQVARALAADLR